MVLNYQEKVWLSSLFGPLRKPFGSKLDWFPQNTKEKFKFQTLFSHETLEKLFYISAIKGLSLGLFKNDPNKTK